MRMIDADKYQKDLLSAYDDVSMEFEVLDRQPLVSAIPIPNGATNGDMIKAMFPNAKTWEVTRDDVHCAYIEFKDICEIKSFPLSWWNAPYKGD
jgi:hypothetical protein